MLIHFTRPVVEPPASNGVLLSGEREEERLIKIAKGPYIKDVRKIFGILDPLPPPCPHFDQTYKS